ncbi:MAG: phosphonate ABC transporter, permease protein PhnE [Deltaproteobacteria bacterium RIFCSPLOWO2_12_FULL_60_19]|nr:MAG: phosphonate ABC transporter, permease protein PhnE [Deltaproteobacteria bacterium RIFCSPLOWO2_12_FULL_60_19]
MAEQSAAKSEVDIFSEAPPAPKRGARLVLWLALLLLVLIWSFQGAKIRPGELLKGIPDILVTLGRMLPPDFSKITEAKSYFLPAEISPAQLLLPAPLTEEQRRAKQRWWDNTFPQTIVGATIETIQMALAGTVLAFLVAFPVGFLAARNTTPHPWVYRGVRAVLNFLRTIPDLALGLLFVAAVGLGAFAGTLALFVHTATVLGKLLSEAVENIDEGVVEAIRATGAGYSQILAFAVLPQILPDLISFTLYRLETNIRSASVLGLIGAGGIGYLMNTSFRTFQYQEAAAIVLVLVVLVVVVDYASSRLRKLVV